MRTYTITKPKEGAVVFSICDTHHHGLPSGDVRVQVRAAAPDAVCEVCRQDKIRDFIRSANLIPF